MSWPSLSMRWNRTRIKVGTVVRPAAVAVGIGLVAYTDRLITDNLSVGYLYLLPLAFAGMTISQTGQLALFVVSAAVLRESFGPFDHVGWPLVVRNVVVLVTYSLVVLFAARWQRRQQHLTDVISQQRDQLTRDLEEAAVLQRLLIPSHLPAVPGWEIDAKLYPARIVSGDFFDVFWDESSRRFGIVIADVAGKGAAAAMLMPVVQATVRRLRSNGVACDELGASLNTMIVSLADHPRLVSLVYLEIDTQTGAVQYVNMGHPPPVIVKSAAHTTWHWLSLGGAVAGAIPEAVYEIGRERLEPGDTLLLYTDGASEAEDAHAEPFSEPRLADIMSRNIQLSATLTIEAIFAAIEEFRADDSSRDDTTLVVVRRL